MKKMISILSMVLALSLLLGSLPFAVAQTETQEPLYGESFLLRVESETQKEYTLEDFPSIEHATQVYTVKKTPLETGFAYFLLVVLDQSDETLLAEAKQQAETYGEVYKNYLAEDYADCNSLAWFNYPSLELKVGESAVLSTDYSLVEGYYTLHSVMFRVDPEIVDETALVESGYQDWGLSSIYGMQDANTQPWYDDTALKGQLFGKKNEVSPSHSYFSSKDSDQIDLVAVIHDIAGKPGVVETQLIFQGRYHTTDMPSASFSCSTEGIVNHQSVNTVSAVITALQPGETTITAKVSGGGYAPATATCKVTVVEDTSITPSYDNSFVLRAESETDYSFTLSDFKELPNAKGLWVFGKEKTDMGYAYQIMVTDDSQSVESAMAAVSENPFVTHVSRNIFADDYLEKASSVVLSATELEIPVGKTATVKVESSDLKEGFYHVTGIEITVNPKAFTPEWLERVVCGSTGLQFGEELSLFALYNSDDDYASIQDGRLIYRHFDGERFLDEDEIPRQDVISPACRYLIGSDSSVSGYLESFIPTLIRWQGITEAKLVYTPVPGCLPAREEWTVENEEIASITTSGGDINGQFVTVTVTGKRVGETVLTVNHSGGSVSITKTCHITVVEPTTYGDINGDAKVDAVDALTVLQAAVGKTILTQKQTLLADVDGNGDIDAGDALQVLKYAVIKIDKFPVEN